MLKNTGGDVYVQRVHHRLVPHPEIQLTYLQPAGASLCIGMISGAIINSTMHDKVDRLFMFSPNAFFYGFLPIIIYSAGLNLQRKNFFQDFWTISLFACRDGD